MNLKQLHQQIDNGALAHFYTISGDEMVLIQRAHQAFKDLISSDDREMNFSQIDLSQQTVADFINESTSLPFFGNHRVVMAFNPEFLTAKGKISEQEQAQLIQLLNNPVPENIVVFVIADLKIDKRKKVTKTLLQNTENIELPLLDEKTAKQAIIQHLQQYDYVIDEPAMAEFLSRTNASYTEMINELPKLMAYAIKNKTIGLEAVNGLVPKTLTATVFDLVDAVMKKQVDRALKIYRDLLRNGEPPLRVNAVLLNQFRLILQVAGLHGTDQDMSKALSGIHPYRIKLARQMLSKYTPRALRSGYLGMVSIEIKLKSTTQDPELLFERFILKQMSMVS